jgi:hypothetical protein
MEGLSWGQTLFTIISSMAAVWLAAYLKAKQVSFKKVYGFCVAACALLGYMFFLFLPRNKMASDICWIPIGEHCIPSPWVLVVGFAFGNLIAFALWLGMQQKR